MKDLFPRTTVGGVSVSRMIIGTNWMAGWSHTGAAADAMIHARNDDPKNLIPMLETFVNNGIDTIMAPMGKAPHVLTAIRETEQKTGKKMIIVDTPSINVEDSAAGRREAEATIRACRENGSTFCLLHHVSVEQLINKEKHEIRRIEDYLKMVRDNGLIPGFGAHMPEVITYADEQGYDVETYIQIYNCMGFLMQVEIETVNRVIRKAKHPVMTIKSMAAGRTTPFVGLNFSWATIRDCDMITVGCFTEKEAAEDIEISRAALERRAPDLAGRSSPDTNQVAVRHD